MTLLGYVVATVVLCGPSAPGKQAQSIERFFEVMKTKSPSIENLEQLFGGGEYAELQTLLAIHFPGLSPDAEVPSDSAAVEFTRTRLANPKGESQFLGCIRRLEPLLFKLTGRIQISANLAPANDSIDRRAVATQGGRVVFVFEKGSSLIGDIEMPDGRSIYTLIPFCGRDRKDAKP
jgi:hypothetical protein